MYLMIKDVSIVDYFIFNLQKDVHHVVSGSVPAFINSFHGAAMYFCFNVQAGEVIPHQEAYLDTSITDNISSQVEMFRFWNRT